MLTFNPALLWAIINLLQVFYYFLFINVDYPYNAKIFFEILKIGTLDFLPNPFKIFFPNLDNHSIKPEKKFEE